MGKGDRKSKKGKIFRHSFGNSRPKKSGASKSVQPDNKSKKAKE